MMKRIDEKSIQCLPFHDSDFLGLKISQKDNGETDLILNLAFYKGEFENLSEDYLKAIELDGNASLLFENCDWIKIHTICNRLQRDEIDFIQFVHDLPNLEEGKKHIEVVFISGSKLECVADKIVLLVI